MEDLLTTDACTLPTTERPLRLAEFDSLFATAARRVDRDSEDGVRIRLAGEPGLVERIQELTQRESACCSFFTFSLEGSDQDLELHVSVPAERRDILDALADRAEEHAAGAGGASA